MKLIITMTLNSCIDVQWAVDSFVGGMTYGLARGLSLREAFGLGVAAASATVLTAGTELCHREDVERMYEQVIGYPLGCPA